MIYQIIEMKIWLIQFIIWNLVKKKKKKKKKKKTYNNIKNNNIGYFETLKRAETRYKKNDPLSVIELKYI